MAQSQLDYLRSKSQVDCDTLDLTVPAILGPFVDCTSNQAIAASELSKPEHASLVNSSASIAKEIASSYSEIPIPTLAVEIMMVQLSLRITPHLTGFCHIQTDPLLSFNTAATIANARRIVAHFGKLAPDFPSSRVCIKIPSTWEGLQACRVLEKEGIATLATTLFNLTQAAVAAEVGCKYIAPYVNSLRVHFVTGAVDDDKGFWVAAAAQRYFKKFGYERTECLPASLISTNEVLQLAGADHITVAPALLQGLAETPYDPATTVPSVFDTSVMDQMAEPTEKILLADNEPVFRMAMNRSKDGKDEAKLVEAINIFSKQQESLLALAIEALAKVA